MSQNKIKMLGFVVIMMVLFCITTTESTTMLELSLKDLCSESSDIIVTRTIALHSYLKPDQKRIYTDIQFEVNDRIKGRLQKGNRKL